MEPAEMLEKARQKLPDLDPRRRLEGVVELTAVAERLEVDERQEIVALLSELASDSEPFVRWNVAIALGEIGHESGVEVLEKKVQDGHANVRFRVALALGLIGSKRGVAVLEKLLDDSYEIAGHFVVRDFVAMALGKIGDLSGVSALAKLAGDEDGLVRWHAAVALGDIGHESADIYTDANR